MGHVNVILMMACAVICLIGATAIPQLSTKLLVLKLGILAVAFCFLTLALIFAGGLTILRYL